MNVKKYISRDRNVFRACAIRLGCFFNNQLVLSVYTYIGMWHVRRVGNNYCSQRQQKKFIPQDEKGELS